tara:strand:+ start:5147 stop:5659 length:513 start_codon:yes stop_codon:yes gene_type:complete
MKWIAAIGVLCLAFTGCNLSPLSPDLDNQIQNQDGKIEELKNNQNGIIAEVGKLRQESSIIARDLENVQQGLLNINAHLSSNENSGVQILQGDGALMMIFGLGTIFIISTFYYRSRGQKAEQTASMLAQAIARYDDVNLNNEVFATVMNTDVEKEVYQLITKSQVEVGVR